MRLEINAGGLDSFFNGVCSFITAGINNATSDSLINSFQNVTNKTCGISGGVGTLNTALGFINTRKTAEESRKIAVQNVKSKTDSFIQTSIRVDKSVAGIVKNSTEAFYRTNPWLRPPAPPSDWDRFCSGVGGAISGFCGVVGDVINSIGGVVEKVGKFFQSVGEVFLNVLNGIKEWVVTHWAEILIVVSIVAVAVLAVALSVVTFGAAGFLIAGIAAGVGALCGAGGQLFSDFLNNITGNQVGFSSWQTYVGAAAGGAIGGIITFCGHPAIGGAVSGSMSKIIGGMIENKPADEIAFDAILSGAVGGIAGLAAGVLGKSFSSVIGGRGGAAAVFKSGITKIGNGNAAKMSWHVFINGTSATWLGNFYKDTFKWGLKTIFKPIPVS